MAAVIAAILAAGSGIAAGKSQSNSSKKSAAAQSAAYQKAYEESQRRLGPYSAFGRGALRNLGRLTNNPALSSFSASYEAEELSQLKSELAGLAVPADTRGKYLGPLDIHGKRRNTKKKQALAREMSAYNANKQKLEARIAELEPIVAKQKEQEALQPETTGADYLRELPSYQFRFAEGERAVGANQSKRNMALSGAALKELTQYGQGFASTEYDKEFNRLMAMAGMGQNTDVGLSNLSMGFGAANAAIAQGLGQDQATTAASYNNAVQSGLANYQYAQNKNNPNNNPNSAYSQGNYNATDQGVYNNPDWVPYGTSSGE